ncbi:MAG: 50S ribosomal protein L22 [Chloroflexi bacterium]|nr:50S ribosomal protein L22 [Chloroflexota bacterium]MBM3154304.1 50S ribosomal protein L22 [Chloroflexota bacterium]MBM3172941.1 50S ribosomal protein L22 [Chloroflexota bacterium]MBM3174486.1 50S ribosomal protein L22 [Chloroflexota bacterium]MBM4449564.1 50S ribosomal protein L22 [Chloroflexota bacterium]
MKVKAIAKDVHISPRKVKLVADTVRGKRVEEALQLLKFTPTPAAQAVAKVIKSASANAENNYQLEPSELRVTEIMANEGHVFKRFRPQARGRINPILKRTTHITVSVSEEKA